MAPPRARQDGAIAIQSHCMRPMLQKKDAVASPWHRL